MKLFDEIHIQVYVPDNITNPFRKKLIDNIENFVFGMRAEKVARDAITLDLKKEVAKLIRIKITQ